MSDINDHHEAERKTRRGIVASAVVGAAGVGALTLPDLASAASTAVMTDNSSNGGNLAAGEVVVATAASTVATLAAGLNAQSLTVDSALSAPNKLRWRGRIEKAVWDAEFGSARGDGTTDCTAAFNSAFLKLASSPTAPGYPVAERVLVVPPGDWMVTGPIRLRSGVHLVMDKGARIIAGSSFTGSAVFLGYQADAVSNGSLTDVTIEVNGKNADGIRIGGGSDYLISRPTVNNAGKAGIYFAPGLINGVPTRSTRPRVEAPRINVTGLTNPEGDVSYGVGFESADGPIVLHPTVLGAQGFGVLFKDSPDWQCWGGRIEQAANATSFGFEAVGATDSSPRGLIVGTSILNSKDNGVSLTADRCIAALLHIEGTENHGIWLGSYGQALGNVIRNVGNNSITAGSPTQWVNTGGDSNKFAGVRLVNDAVGCTVAFNTIVESRSTGERTGNLVKAVGTGGGRHQVFGNVFEPTSGGTLKGSRYYGFERTSKVTEALGDSLSCVTSSSTTYTFGDNDTVWVATGNADKTAVLPAIADAVPGRVVTIKNALSTQKVTIQGNGATIDGSSTLVLETPKEAVTLISTGTEWAVIGRYVPKPPSTT